MPNITQPAPAPRYRVLPAPIRTYHGSPCLFDRFELSERGSFCSGIYCADVEAAKNYADSGGFVYEVEINLINPYHYSASFDHELDFDSAAVDLIRTVLPGWAATVLHDSMYGDGMFGHSVTQALMDLGHDGLIVTYEDGSQEIIAFHPDQVTILSVLALAHAAHRAA